MQVTDYGAITCLRTSIRKGSVECSPLTTKWRLAQLTSANRTLFKSSWIFIHKACQILKEYIMSVSLSVFVFFSLLYLWLLLEYILLIITCSGWFSYLHIKISDDSFKPDAVVETSWVTISTTRRHDTAKMLASLQLCSEFVLWLLAYDLRFVSVIFIFLKNPAYLIPQ